MPYWGRYHWVLQTWLQLREEGWPVELVRQLPEDGIVISHVDCFDYGLGLSPRRFVVALLVDREVPSPCAGIHVTHNPVQALPFGMRHRYIPPWPQVSLIPRAASRGRRFDTVGFFGYPNNLHPDLASSRFRRRLGSLGLDLVTPHPGDWNDFSHIDAVVAIRNFGHDEQHLNKPSLKLFNAWLANVPAVLGYEAAYRAEGLPGQGYLEATSENDAYAALARLAEQPRLRDSIVKTGASLVRTFSETATRQRWFRFIDAELVPAYAHWTSSVSTRFKHRIATAGKERLLWRMPGRFAQKRSPARHGPGST